MSALRRRLQERAAAKLSPGAHGLNPACDLERCPGAHYSIPLVPAQMDLLAIDV